MDEIELAFYFLSNQIKFISMTYLFSPSAERFICRSSICLFLIIVLLRGSFLCLPAEIFFCSTAPFLSMMTKSRYTNAAQWAYQSNKQVAQLLSTFDGVK